MSAESFLKWAIAHWRDALEIAVLWALIHQGWVRFRENRGIRTSVSLVLGALGVMVLSEMLELKVLEWLLRNASTLALFAIVVIFQPELRRVAASLGTNQLFSLSQQNRETIEVLSELTFDLANRQLGALLAIERDLPLDSRAESGVELDSKLSVELGVSIFHPKTPLHDGGLIVRGDRLLAGACIFPISQRVDLDRNLGLRHRAGLGLSEETDAVVIVVSEETGVVSICHDGTIERNFDPESFKTRLARLLNPVGNEDSAE